jgi:hypothetical protein
MIKELRSLCLNVALEQSDDIEPAQIEQQDAA